MNCLFYLNSEWKEEYGGSLELWDKNMQQCVKRISPKLNTLVIFETSSYSWHGLPDPISLPKGRSRKSFAFYYYTSESGAQEKESHWTRHRERPESKNDGFMRSLEKNLLNLTPPVLYPFIRRFFK